MSKETVRIMTDRETYAFREVPIEEVPPGYVRAHFQDHGEFYIDTETLKAIKPSAKIRHPPFPDEVIGILQQQLSSGIGEGMGMTYERWEHGFRCDTHPWREIAHWERFAGACRRFAGHLTAQDDSTREKRGDVFMVVNSLINSTPLKGRKVTYGAHGSVTTGRVKEIADWLFAAEREQEAKHLTRWLRKLLLPGGTPGPERIPLAGLFAPDGTGLNLDADFDVRDLIDEVDVIVALDVDTGNRRVVYGREACEGIVGSGIAENP